jgi:hypothetical protein
MVSVCAVKISRDIPRIKMFIKQTVNQNTRIFAGSVPASLALASAALAQKSYDPGAVDIELRIGNIR